MALLGSSRPEVSQADSCSSESNSSGASQLSCCHLHASAACHVLLRGTGLSLAEEFIAPHSDFRAGDVSQLVKCRLLLEVPEVQQA